MSQHTFVEALTCFVDEDYDKCVSILNKLLETEPNLAELHDKLAAVYLLKKDFPNVIKYENTATKLEQKKPEYFVRKGIAEFHLDKFKESLSSFSKAIELNSSGIYLSAKLISESKRYLRKAQAEVEVLEADSSDESVSESDSEQHLELDIDQAINPDKFKFDFYQSDVALILTIRAKDCDPSKVDIQFLYSSLIVSIDSDYKRKFKLFNNIVPEESNFKVQKTKIEIKLKKAMEKEHWPELERQNVEYDTGGRLKNAYTSKRNWTEVEKVIKKQEEEEKPEGDEALNKLFKDIYGKASDETRRAMNKSFQTSGGTVLSTNWKEVAKADYEKEKVAPTGMEWKDWEGKNIGKHKTDDEIVEEYRRRQEQDDDDVD